VAVVRGYKKEAVDLAGLRFFDNDAWAETGELWSLYQARDLLNDNLVLSYGDVIFDDFILQNLISHEQPISIAADASWKLRDRPDEKRDLVATKGYFAPVGDSRCTLVDVGPGVTKDEVTGEFIGLVYLSAAGARTVAEALDRMAQSEPEVLKKGDLRELFMRLRGAGHDVNVVHTFGRWRDLDTEADLLEPQA
jgi:phosphoenolpyruvate phosphomutase